MLIIIEFIIKKQQKTVAINEGIGEG